MRPRMFGRLAYDIGVAATIVTTNARAADY
jgi:hypothetical protein